MRKGEEIVKIRECDLNAVFVMMTLNDGIRIESAWNCIDTLKKSQKHETNNKTPKRTTKK